MIRIRIAALRTATTMLALTLPILACDGQRTPAATPAASASPAGSSAMARGSIEGSGSPRASGSETAATPEIVYLAMQG